MVRYARQDQIAAGPPGARVRLRLQTRDIEGVEDFDCVSWRTTYPGTSSNRRFYMTNGQPWLFPATVAMSLLTTARELGMLDEEHDDPFQRWGGGSATHVRSLELPKRERLSMLRALTIDDEDFERWKSGHFVVGAEPTGRWQKVMFVDWAQDLATVRSMTQDLTYRPSKRIPHWVGWRMDNAMQDVNTATAREFWGLLVAVASGRA